MKPKLLQLEITGNRAKKAADDPAFVALVEKGWTVGVYWFGNEEDADEEGSHLKRQFLFMLLLPPREAAAVAVQLEEPLGQILETSGISTDRLVRWMQFGLVVFTLMTLSEIYFLRLLL